MAQRSGNWFSTQSYNGVNIHITWNSDSGWAMWLDDEMVDSAICSAIAKQERNHSEAMDALELIGRGLADNINALIAARLSDPIFNHISAADKELIARPYTSADHPLP
jgi:hypothetical protein